MRVGVALMLASFLTPFAIVARCKTMDSHWQIGIARMKITPQVPVWLAGYGSRRPFEVVLQDIWAKVMAMRDARGHQAVIITTDLEGLSEGEYLRLLAALKDRYGLRPAQIMFCFSHNHCAPVTRDDLQDYYPIDEEQQRHIDAYTDWLHDLLVEGVGQALADLRPATLWRGEGLCTFAVNRRNNPEAEVPGMLERGEPLKGPVDHRVPILAVKEPDGRLRAVLFGYACHNTTLSGNELCGDYAGYAQEGVEKALPGVTGLFFMGCGADSNPIPRRKTELAAKYGAMLATAVTEALAGSLEQLSPELRTTHEFITIPFERNVTVDELKAAAAEGDSVHGRWGRRWLKQLDEGAEMATSFRYPIMVWRLGELLWINMGGEAVVDYAYRFRAEYGQKTWIGGYTSIQAAYIPSRRVWDEGGYEGGAFLYEYGHPATRWTGDVEDRIAAGVARLVKVAR